jgi:hypothetical protein
MQTKITKSAVEALEPGKAIWDDKLKGFGARRQKDGIFYYLRYRVNRIPFMKSLGRHGHLTPDQARKASFIGSRRDSTRTVSSPTKKGAEA